MRFLFRHLKLYTKELPFSIFIFPKVFYASLYKKAPARRYHTFSQKWYLLAKAYYSAKSQNTPLLWYSNGSFIRLQNTHPFLLLNIPQTAENQGFFESRQTVSIFPWTLILYCIAKVCNRFSKWGNCFIPLLYRILSV